MQQVKFERSFYAVTEACVLLCGGNDGNDPHLRSFVDLAVHTKSIIESIAEVLKRQLSKEMRAFLYNEARRLYFILNLLPVPIRREILHNILFGIINVDEERYIEASRESMSRQLASAFRVPKPHLVEVAGTNIYVLDFETFVLNLVYGYQPSVRSVAGLGLPEVRGTFYIVSGQGDAARYLHSDGSLQRRIIEKEGVYGYFTSREDAQEVIRQNT